MPLESRRRFARATRLAMVLAALAAPATVWSAGSHRLAIGATVIAGGSCTFSGPGSSALSFGSIDPSSSKDSTASIDIPYRCNGGAAATVSWSVASNDGLHKSASSAPRLRHVSEPTQYLRYSLHTPSPASSARNVDLTMTVMGTVAAADFQDAPAGSYADSVVLTITP